MINRFIYSELDEEALKGVSSKKADLNDNFSDYKKVELKPSVISEIKPTFP